MAKKCNIFKECPKNISVKYTSFWYPVQVQLILEVLCKVPSYIMLITGDIIEHCEYKIVEHDVR